MITSYIGDKYNENYTAIQETILSMSMPLILIKSSLQQLLNEILTDKESKSKRLYENLPAEITSVVN
jgi:hypothetical protein